MQQVMTGIASASRARSCRDILSHAVTYRYQSSSELPGIVIFGAFMILIVIMLLNTLIAMMAETYTRISLTAFRNYAFSFGKVLVSQRCKPGSAAVPLNLLSLPYYSFSVISVAMQGAASRLRRVPFSGALARLRHSSRLGIPAMGAAWNSTHNGHRLKKDRRDTGVVKIIDDIRLMLLHDSNKKLSFERSVARFCRVQARTGGV